MLVGTGTRQMQRFNRRIVQGAWQRWYRGQDPICYLVQIALMATTHIVVADAVLHRRDELFVAHAVDGGMYTYFRWDGVERGKTVRLVRIGDDGQRVVVLDIPEVNRAIASDRVLSVAYKGALERWGRVTRVGTNVT